jgi:hypothetical protein
VQEKRSRRRLVEEVLEQATERKESAAGGDWGVGGHCGMSGWDGSTRAVSWRAGAEVIDGAKAKLPPTGENVNAWERLNITMQRVDRYAAFNGSHICHIAISPVMWAFHARVVGVVDNGGVGWDPAGCWFHLRTSVTAWPVAVAPFR